MNRAIFGLSPVLVLMVTGCDRKTPRAVKPAAAHIGVASFYGREFAGKKTANGETFHVDKMTAASRTLPLGTHAKVVNLETGQAAQVRINDRGPYAKGRLIDLTPKAARHIGIGAENGVARVSVQPVLTPTAPTS